MSEIIHMTPKGDAANTPCCDKSVFELPRDDRMTLDPEQVTCWFIGDIAEAEADLVAGQTVSLDALRDAMPDGGGE